MRRPGSINRSLQPLLIHQTIKVAVHGIKEYPEIFTVTLNAPLVEFSAVMVKQVQLASAKPIDTQMINRSNSRLPIVELHMRSRAPCDKSSS